MYKLLTICVCLLAVANVGVLGEWLAKEPAYIAKLGPAPSVKVPPLKIKPASSSAHGAKITLAVPAPAKTFVATKYEAAPAYAYAAPAYAYAAPAYGAAKGY